MGGMALPVDQVVKRVDARPVRDTQLLQVVVDSEDPDQAAQLANLVARTFVQQVQTRQDERFAAQETALQSQVDQLSAALATATANIAQARAQPAGIIADADIARSQAELIRLQDSYAAGLRGLEDVRLAQARSSDLLTLVDPATPPPTPLTPRLLPTFVLAAVIGLIIAVVIASVVEWLDDRLSAPERLARLTGLPTQAFLADQPPAAVTDACRLLWARLQFATRDDVPRSLLVTSVAAGDGKTIVATNLAIAAAESGKRIVLVDADLYHPSLHEVLQVRPTTDLTDLLFDRDRAVEDALVPTRIDGLRLVRVGQPSAAGGGWLAERRMRQRFAELRQVADLVILDAPPVLAVSDATLLTSLADGTILVVDARARSAQVSLALSSVQSAGGRLVGAVLNRVQPAS
jgi:non-specific protein-tyrosine kinase